MLESTSERLMETVHAAIYTIKYGGIVVLRDLSPEKAYALYVLRQNIYTDPQKPIQVERKSTRRPRMRTAPSSSPRTSR
jgi:acetyl-CoA decarbonylase/synthase complex subunit gamma